MLVGINRFPMLKRKAGDVQELHTRRIQSATPANKLSFHRSNVFHEGFVNDLINQAKTTATTARAVQYTAGNKCLPKTRFG